MPVPGLLNFRRIRRHTVQPPKAAQEARDFQSCEVHYQKNTDERFDKVFQYIEDHAESEQKIFFDGQIYDAFSLITSIIQKA